MHVTRDGFLVLRAMVEGEDITQELGPKALDRARRVLNEMELLDGDTMTDLGREVLEQYRVKNAIIQAAGLCSRCAPISYDIPKGLIKLHGEPIVERQIRQLREKGITDITVCTGHLANRYDYLADKYGVKLSFNPEYALFNSMTTIYRVLDRIGATYLLHSDHYYPENPFHAYEYRSFYFTRYDTCTDEWKEIVDEDYNLKIYARRKDSAGIHVQGLWFISHEMSKVMVPLVEKCFNEPDLKDNYVEHVLWLGMGSLHTNLEPQPHGICEEFDRMEEALELDPDFLDNVESPSLDNICRELGCTRHDLHDIYPVETYPSHASCRFTVGDTEYLYSCSIGDDFATRSWSLKPLE